MEIGEMFDPPGSGDLLCPHPLLSRTAGPAAALLASSGQQS